MRLKALTFSVVEGEGLIGAFRRSIFAQYCHTFEGALPTSIFSPRNMGPRTLIAILAGGRSRRMGVDKAALPMGGTTWLGHIVRQAMLTSCLVAVVGREWRGAEAMPEFRCLEDEQPGLGPIGGLLTALRYADSPVLAVGCDMPFLTRASFDWLLARANEEIGELGLAVRSSAGLEPLFSYYTTDCLPIIDRHIADRRLSLQSLLTQPEFRTIEAPASIQDALRNVNTEVERLRLGL